MLIRYENIIAEVDTAKYTEAVTQGKFVKNVRFVADTLPELDILTQAYTNLSNVKYYDPSQGSYYNNAVIRSQKYQVQFDGYEAIRTPGILFQRNDKEIYFLECTEANANELLDKLVVDRYLDLRN